MVPTVVPVLTSWFYRATAVLPWSLWCPVSLGATVVTLRSLWGLLLFLCLHRGAIVSLWCYCGHRGVLCHCGATVVTLSCCLIVSPSI